MKKWITKINNWNNSIKNNPNIIVLIIVFNCALLMEFHDYYLARPKVFVVLFISVLLNLINTKYWFSAVFSYCFSFLHFAKLFPRQANHSNLEFFVEIFVGFTLVYYFFLSSKKPKLFTIQHVFKIALICIYFYAGFHKLNSGYFSVDSSCANAIGSMTFSNFFGHDYKLSNFAVVVFQYLTIIIEMIIPFGLLFRKTQKTTVLVLVAFHIFLSLSKYADFSAFAGFMLLASTINWTQKSITTSKINWLKVYVAFVLFSVLIEVLIYYFKIENINVFFASGIIFSIGFVLFYYQYLLDFKPTTIRIPKKQLMISSIATITFISIWALKTYVGLGNVANLTMFSNLNTEKNHSNHYLINTKYTKIFDFEEDNLKIISLEDTLKYKKLEGYNLPIVEFNYNVKKWSAYYKDLDLKATVVYKNDTIVINDLKNSEFNTQKWYHKYLFFRKIQIEGETDCFW